MTVNQPTQQAWRLADKLETMTKVENPQAYGGRGLKVKRIAMGRFGVYEPGKSWTSYDEAIDAAVALIERSRALRSAAALGGEVCDECR